MKLCILVVMILTTTLLSAHADPFSWNSLNSHLETSLVSGNSIAQVSQGFYKMDYGWDGQVSPVSLSWASVKVPEPASLFLLGSGLIGIASTVRRKHKTVRS